MKRLDRLVVSAREIHVGLPYSDEAKMNGNIRVVAAAVVILALAYMAVSYGYDLGVGHDGLRLERQLGR